MFVSFECSDVSEERGTAERLAVLDRVHLASQALDDPALAREVLAMFLDQSGDMLRKVRDAAMPVDRRQAAHRLKGSARAVGAFRVAATSEQVEFLPDDVDDDTLLERIAALHATVAEVRSAIAAELAGGDRPGL
jgi:HPt (histidine-containing phosphotransfer) domain-containing protein